MININNSFETQASKELVWKTITELADYKEWNTFVSDCRSSLKPQDAIWMKVHLFPFPIWQKETILENKENELLDYGVSVPFSLLRSSRKHIISELADGTVRYESRFVLEGLISPLVKLMMATRLQKGFSLMSEGLENRIKELQELQ